MTAPVMVARALSTLALSPPDITQRIPPMMTKITAIIIPKISSTVIILPTILSAFCSLRLHSLPKSPVGQRSAETGTAEAKNIKPKDNNAEILFILTFIIKALQLNCQYYSFAIETKGVKFCEASVSGGIPVESKTSAGKGAD